MYDDLFHITEDEAGNKIYKFIDHWVGKRLKQLRLDHGYPIETVANLIDVSAGEFAQIETGEVRISIRNLNILSTFFNIEATEIFDDAKAFLQKLDLHEQKTTASPAEGLRLLRHFQNIQSARHRQILLEQAELFAAPDDEQNH